LQTVRHRFNINASSCVAMAPQTRYTLRRNTASKMKGLVWLAVPEVKGVSPKKLFTRNFGLN